MHKLSWRAVPGIIATILMTAVASLWVFWSLGELFYEGWSTPLPGPLMYLIPGTLALTLCIAALRMPLFGGIALLLVGSWFGFNWLNSSIRAGVSGWDLVVRFFLSGMVAVIGLMFLYDHRYRRKRVEEGWTPPKSWWLRNLRYLVVTTPAVVILVGMVVYWLPILSTREDDGGRGERLIEGPVVSLVWAPEGPGWNWRQHFGGFPSWEALALYGEEPVGMDRKREFDGPQATRADMRSTNLCLYLSADGLSLEAEPRNIWRFPTAHELVSSLMLHGENAGCVLSSDFPSLRYSRSACTKMPDKETPLWAPDLEPIYYWVADEFNEERAFYINYQGAINAQPKRWGNPRHGYRCVRDP